MRILIAGATGFIGSEIVEVCRERDVEVHYLTTSRSKIEKKPFYRGFHWNPGTGEIDTECLEGVVTIINLAGESVFQRWTARNKSRILNSRIDSAKLLHETLSNNEHQVGQYVSASAIGVYPHSYEKMYFEDEENLDEHFLGQVVQKWEAAADEFKELGLRVAKIRTGLALGEDGGALPKLSSVIKMNIGAVLGKGKQWQSWIHVRDVARIYLHVVENGLTGVYNAVAPNPATHRQMMNELARHMGKTIWLPKVPAFVLKGIMGEMACTILSSQLVASKKIEETGFSFEYTNLNKAFRNI